MSRVPVTMTPPKVVVYDRGIYYQIEVLVGNKTFTHFSYESVEEVVTESEEHVKEILNGFDNI